MNSISETAYSYSQLSSDKISDSHLPLANRKKTSEQTPTNDKVEISPEGRQASDRMNSSEQRLPYSKELPPDVQAAVDAYNSQRQDEFVDEVVATAPQIMDEPLPENASIQTLGSMTLQSGRQVSIEKFVIPPSSLSSANNSSPPSQNSKVNDVEEVVKYNEAGGADRSQSGNGTVFGYRAVISSSDGQSSQFYLLTSDTIINEDDDGVITLSGYRSGDETTGDDFIIGFHGRALDGGSGNDTLIELSEDYRETALEVGYEGTTETSASKKETATGAITGGAGDDTVILVGKKILSVSVSTGSGNDMILSSGDIEISKLDTGSGDDIVQVHGNLSIRGEKVISDGLELHRTDSDSGPFFNTGSGNDIVMVGGDLDIKGGRTQISYGPNKEDIEIDLDFNSKKSWDEMLGRTVKVTSMDTGSGDDIIDVGGSMRIDSGTIRTGDGDDVIRTKKSVIMSGNYLSSGWTRVKGSIDTGSGNDSIHAGKDLSMENAVIDTGEGDDSILTSKDLDMEKSFINTGSGDDNVSAGQKLSINHSSAVITSSGDDTISVGDTLHVYYKSALTTADGNDTVMSGKAILIDCYSLVKTGSGDDNIMSGDRMLTTGDSILSTGQGNDHVGANRALTASGYGLISTGQGNDCISTNRDRADDNTREQRYGVTVSSNGAIDTGDGDDYIDTNKLDVVSDGILRTGRGDDFITSDKAELSGSIDAGDGSDRITIGSLRVLQGGTMRAGKGNDSIIVHNTELNGSIDTGDGDDSVKIDELRVLPDGSIQTGTGNDSVIVRVTETGILFPDGHAAKGRENKKGTTMHQEVEDVSEWLAETNFNLSITKERLFKGITAYEKQIDSGNFDSEKLTRTRQGYLEEDLRKNGYKGNLE
ncbi:hypothetical protein [Desulfovibrio gilichinskyi]|uniref:hypothetical protein n=1 Tax=Desulfovibrio gilichinskyi TaxID=1519643 RepID=UPI000A157131|nr:hypothetical protein [Desulfovibrio gilichinskyi]